MKRHLRGAVGARIWLVLLLVGVFWVAPNACAIVHYVIYLAQLELGGATPVSWLFYAVFVWLALCLLRPDAENFFGRENFKLLLPLVSGFCLLLIGTPLQLSAVL
jgi:hypothetical protein